MKNISDKSFAGYQSMDAFERKDASLAPNSLNSGSFKKEFSTNLPSGGTGSYDDSTSYIDNIMAKDSAKAKGQRYNP